MKILEPQTSPRGRLETMLSWMAEACKYTLAMGLLAWSSMQSVCSQEPPPKTEDEIKKVEDLFGDFESDSANKPDKETKPELETPKKPDNPATDQPATDQPVEKAAEKPPAEEAKPAAKRKPRVVPKAKEAKPADAPAEDAMIEEGVQEAAVAVDVVMAMNGDGMGEASIAKSLQVEKAFLRRVCKLNDEQEKNLTGLDVKWAMKKAIPGGNRIVNGVMIGGDSSMPPSMIRRYLEKALTKELADVLDQEQKERYLQETAARRSFDSEANLEAAVILLDTHLVLREDQFDTIRTALRKSFRSETDPRMYFYNPQYLPQLPDASILKHLDAEQKDIYRGLQKVNFGFGQEDLGDVIEK